MLKPAPVFTLSLLLLAGAAAQPLAAWGALGHRMSAAASLQDLPPDLAPWFQGQDDVLRDHVNDPDKWKESDPQEGPRHYLDCEAYGGPTQVPLSEDDAQARLGAEAFLKSGLLPWTIQNHVHQLAGAFTAGDPGQVALEAAILCHYVGDSQVPLHTTQNHNGDMTGQHGVHKRWETTLLERIVDQEDWVPAVRRAELGPSPQTAPWAWLQQSFELVAGLLADDATAEAPDGQIQHRGEEAMAPGYWEAFERLQGPHVKEQLTLAGQRSAQMILLAWTLAGKPAAPPLKAYQLTR